ncbi:MAG: glycerophosphoryl diester phosphodiesterase membrane domain-containing protein [Saccharospirillum sp.]|nr:glycerophosphoryl diester phosphodiesterase membrane domain-containing protein [Saccharospirillum sp.]
MRSLSRYLRLISISVRHHWRPLMAYYLYTSLLLAAVLVPAIGWSLTAMLSLTGETMVGNIDLIRLAATPLGALWVISAASLAAMLVFVQHAGMMALITPDSDRQYPTVLQALTLVARKLPSLLVLALIQVIAHLLLASPLLWLLALGFERILGDFDIYYVLLAKPAEYWRFLGLALLIAAGLILLNGSLYVRWLLAMPFVVFENYQPWQALHSSARSTKGVRLTMALLVLSVAVLVTLAPFLLSTLFSWSAAVFIAPLPSDSAIVLSMMALLIVGFAVTGWLVGFIGVSTNSLLIAKLYRQCRQKPLLQTTETRPRHGGTLAFGIEFLVVVVALGQVAFALQVFDQLDRTDNIAHRGSPFNAPENTLSAIDAAIAEGADYVELDVRRTRDGVLVLLHDRDLRRVAADPRTIWQVDYEELREMDVGSWFSAEFAGEQVPTLAEAVERIRGRAGLYLEIKQQPGAPDLVADVIAELEALEMIDQTILAALELSALQQARQLAPDLRLSMLVHSSVGSLASLPVDILAMRDALATPQNVRLWRSHGYEVHLWTVNDARDMARLLDIGVDGIITDRPELLSRVMEERAESSAIERWLLRLRYWSWTF